MSIKRYGAEGGKGTGGQHLPFARAVEADGWLYVSGQVPMLNGEVVEGNIVAQAHQAIGDTLSLEAQLAGAQAAVRPSGTPGRRLRDTDDCSLDRRSRRIREIPPLSR